MIDFIKNVNEDAKIAVGLTIAEKMFKLIGINDNGYNLGREALDRCWEWLEIKEIEADDLCDYIDNRDGEIDVSGFVYIAKGMKDVCTWHVLLYAISYTSWQAYNNEDGYPPEVLDNVDDKILITIVETALKSELFKIESVNRVKEYLLENYPIGSDSESSAITKEEIMKMVGDNY